MLKFSRVIQWSVVKAKCKIRATPQPSQVFCHHLEDPPYVASKYSASLEKSYDKKESMGTRKPYLGVFNYPGPENHSGKNCGAIYAG